MDSVVNAYFGPHENMKHETRANKQNPAYTSEQRLKLPENWNACMQKTAQRLAEQAAAAARPRAALATCRQIPWRGRQRPDPA